MSQSRYKRSIGADTRVFSSFILRHVERNRLEIIVDLNLAIIIRLLLERFKQLKVESKVNDVFCMFVTHF